MGEPFVGEIRMFAGTFAPNGWALCQGQSLPISENDTLFNLIGTTYGGDGQETFKLPDLQGRAPIHMGTGPGLSTFSIGQEGGVESVTLNTQQMPLHNHPVIVSDDIANSNSANKSGRSPISFLFTDGPSGLFLDFRSGRNVQTLHAVAQRMAGDF